MAAASLSGSAKSAFGTNSHNSPALTPLMPDGPFEMAGHGLGAARPGEPLDQPGVRPAGRQVEVDDGLAAGGDLVPQQRRAGIDETALHAGFGDDEFARLVKSMPM